MSLWRGRAVQIVGVCVCGVAAFSAVTSMLIFLSRSWWDRIQLAAILLAIAFPVRRVGNWLEAYGERLQQRARNELAKQRIPKFFEASAKARQEGRYFPPEFCLYLRPFDSAGQLWINVPYHPPVIFSASYWIQPPYRDLESIIHECTPQGQWLVGVGEVERGAGAAKLISTEDNWFQHVVQLSMAASTIVIVPIIRPALMQELRMLRASGLLHKCIFVMPPSLQYQSPFQRPAAFNLLKDPSKPFSIIEEWAKSQTAIRDDPQVNLNLPDYRSAGALMRYSDDGEPGTYIPFDEPEDIMRVLKTAMEENVADVIEACKLDFRMAALARSERAERQ